MAIHESAEDYLETILRIKQRKGTVRSMDIVNDMNYSKPSISVAMKRLRESGHVTMDEQGYIELTDAGRAVAERIYDRHVTIARLLMRLGVHEAQAYEDACKIEHDISDESFARVCVFLQKWEEAHGPNPTI